MNYILGGGPAGLIAAYYFKDYKIIDKNPLGQLNIPFIPGPRLLQYTKNMDSFMKEVVPYLKE
jgi:thioredoxin reductase